ncbi:ankyrin [Lentithecium fluviatile CBS 122367]|uniref:Ankyrin n=1 Tax=Lentithecium fluviatile CBS 122367 TaxID=1168545 RepID=A0A6G1J8Y6_9PLEO|nr:ankyrin [Lentithecium fluviatile CBS 122367]
MFSLRLNTCERRSDQAVMRDGLYSALGRSRLKLKHQVNKSTDNEHMGDATKALETALKETMRRTGEPVNPSSENLDHTTGKATVLYASGSHDIHTASFSDETYGDRTGPPGEPGEATIVKILRKTIPYTYAELLDILEQHYGLGPNEQDLDGWTSLHRAAFKGDLGSVRTLLARKDIEADRRGGSSDVTPLICACNYGHEAVLAALLAHHPPVNPAIRGTYGHSALMRPFVNPGVHTARIAKLLLATGKVDVNYAIPDPPISTPDTALVVAIISGDLEGVKCLLGAGARVKTRENGDLSGLEEAFSVREEEML